MLTVDIDVGGTLTDGLFTAGERVVCVKVDTTPHDLTVCLFDCLTQGATQLGYDDLDAFLEEVGLIRWSTTLTSNVLAELRGPKLGLIVSPGHGADLYGDAQTSHLLVRMVPANTVVEMDPSAPETAVTSAVRSLLEGGVRRICIGLKGADRDAAPEIRMKRIIEQQYPDHFLGSVPVLAGSDVFPGADDATRTACALINAYTHGALAATLFKAEDELRETHRYTRSFFVSHINGGVAGIAKTRAIDTIESGPILGIYGSSYLAKVLGLRDVLALDVGGTTAKLSALQNSEPMVRKPSDLFGISLALSLPYLRSIALGGGSVVKAAASPERQVALGPESMGSYPGPACYGLGGDQATLTDAFVCAGFIDPGYFLGGTKPLHLDLARGALEQHVAGPLHVSVEQACSAIMGRAFQAVAEMVANVKADLQQDVSRHALFAYGGNGGLFACGVAEAAGLDHVYLFSLGPVFSAFGSSSSDICHVYEQPLHLTSFDEAETGRLRQSVEHMKAEGLKDLLGEGIRPDDVSYALEMEVSHGNGRTTAISTPEEALKSPKSLRAHVQKALSRRLTGNGGGDWTIDLARLQVRKTMAKPALHERALQSADSSHARKGSRTVIWGGKCVAAQLYRWESLQPGNRVEGCAVLESPHSTYFVPAGWLLEMDAYGNGRLRRQ